MTILKLTIDKAFCLLSIDPCQLGCGEDRIRTCEDISQQIYSLSQLAALVLPQWYFSGCETGVSLLATQPTGGRPFQTLLQYFLRTTQKPRFWRGFLKRECKIIRFFGLVKPI